MQAGLTSLFMASMNGHLDVVRLLLERKADANLADQVQHTPFLLLPLTQSRGSCTTGTRYHARFKLISVLWLWAVCQWCYYAAKKSDYPGAEASYPYCTRAETGDEHNHGAEAGLQDNRGRRRGPSRAFMLLLSGPS
jgi:hypothetical protein